MSWTDAAPAVFTAFLSSLVEAGHTKKRERSRMTVRRIVILL
jgi:hypothetical protein